MTSWQDEILQKWNKDKAKFEVTDSLRDRLTREFKGEVLYREPMAPHTSMRVGGYADVFLKPKDEADILAIVKIAKETNSPLTIMGVGSNTLVRDAGIRGLVLYPVSAFNQCEVVNETENEKDILLGAGVKINKAVQFAKENSLSGFETWVGIPGSIGGAIFMNAGAHGTEIKDVVREITVIDKDGVVSKISREKMDFEYRKLRLPRGTIIESGLFRLQKGDTEKIGAAIEQYQKKRVETQPLNYPNLGSVFKNPETKNKKAKLFAGQIIEELGLKNVRVGGARISEKHANFIINENNATAKDVLVLINMVKDKVKESTGIVLETEVKIIGEEE